jgi:hypothetical protein
MPEEQQKARTGRGGEDYALAVSPTGTQQHQIISGQISTDSESAKVASLANLSFLGVVAAGPALYTAVDSFLLLT